VKRILVHRLGSLGDTVVALPALRLIRHRFPDAEITVLTNPPVSGKAAPLEAVLENTGLYDSLLRYRIGMREPGEFLKLRDSIRSGRFDLGISLAAFRGLPGSLRDVLFFKATGIPRMMGIPFRREDREPRFLPTGLYESETSRLVRRVRSLGEIDLDEPRWWDLGLRPEEEECARELLAAAGINGPFLAASVGTKVPMKDWGQPNWETLFGKIRELPAVFLGAEDEGERSLALAAGSRASTADFCGKTSPRISAAILRRAALFLGHDSGPMHLAACSGVPCVAIFSARNPPGQWFPHGKENTILYPKLPYKRELMDDFDYQKRAMATITPEEAFAAIASYSGRFSK